MSTAFKIKRTKHGVYMFHNRLCIAKRISSVGRPWAGWDMLVDGYKVIDTPGRRFRVEMSDEVRARTARLAQQATSKKLERER